MELNLAVGYPVAYGRAALRKAQQGYGTIGVNVFCNKSVKAVQVVYVVIYVI